MKSKTLSKITTCVFLWVAICIALMLTEAGMIFLHMYLPKKLEWLIPGSWFLLFILIAARISSYLALSAHKGLSINYLEFSYRYFYIFLTDESRQEWRDFIAKERDRICKKTEIKT